MQNLAELKCTACRGDDPQLADTRIEELLPAIPDWTLKEAEGVKRLERNFRFKDFQSALDFTNRVGVAAEAEGHHPLLCTTWGRVTVTWWTHKIRGLHQNDFIMAARTDALYPG